MTARNWSRTIETLYDKDVAIVGGRLDNVTCGELASFDLVFWCNNHWLRLPAAPIDGLFHCCGPRAPAAPMLSCAELKHITLFCGPAWACEASAFYGHCFEWDIPCFFYGTDPKLTWIFDDLEALCEEVGSTTPLTGLTAAAFMHRMPVRSCALLGQDLYLGQELSPGTAAHNPKGQAQIFKRLLKIDARLKPCPELEHAITELLK